MLAEQFDLLVANAVRPARIRELRGQVGGQAEAVIGLPQQKRSGVGRDARIGLAVSFRLACMNLDRRRGSVR